MNGNRNSRNDWVFSIVANNATYINDKLQDGKKRIVAELRSRSSSSASSSTTADTNTMATGSTTSASADGGWNFHGPNWSLNSFELLKIVYRPSYQALPEFTNISPIYDNMMKGLRTTFTCSTSFYDGSTNAHRKKIDFAQDIYTANDIYHIKQNLTINIRGMGLCRAVQVYLKQHHNENDNDGSIPVEYRKALEKQWNIPSKSINKNLDFMTEHFSESDDTLPLPPWEEQVENSFDDNKNSNNDHQHHKQPIIITFAMPLSFVVDTDHGPPLLWKVQIPPNKYIAVETYTVLNCKLTDYYYSPGDIIPSRCSSGESSDDNNEKLPLYDANNIRHHRHHHEYTPTHLYVNGYQSWSFTGNITKGDPQPQSALPFMFSGAFNTGGRLPPDKDVKTNISRQDVRNNTAGTNDDNSWDDESPGRKLQQKQQYPIRRILPPLQRGVCCDNNLYNGYKSDFFTCISSDGGSKSAKKKPINRNKSDRLLDESGGPALVLGWLSQHHHFGVIQIDAELENIEMHSSAEGQLIKDGNQTDWCYAQLVTPNSYDEEPMVHYLHAVASYNCAKPLQNGSLLTGWCSWYHYYENISQQNLRENFEKLFSLRNKVPMSVSVIDDGYMNAWGDWSSLKPKKFPVTQENSSGISSSGLSVVSRDVRNFGMRPGLWLAPFACDKFSRLAKGHSDWIICNNEGRYANSSNCGKFFYGLDATNPKVRQYVATCIERAVKEYDFDVLKIDFLYAACLAGNGKYDLSISRAEAMHLALQTIRSAAGPTTFLIGCGCPIGTAIGYVDGMRISADTGPTWYPAWPMPWWDHGGTLPCLRTMVRNSITRAPFGHRWWHNDPDCLLLGESTSLTDVEVSSAASIIAMTCGMLLLSDDLTKVTSNRMRILTKIFPMTGATAVPLDLHSCNADIPSMLRLWCTDRYDLAPLKSDDRSSKDSADHNREATFFGRQASFAIDKDIPHPSERKRNCIHVAKGLGTWTLLSLSNWLDEESVVFAPSDALHPPPATGWNDNEELTTNIPNDVQQQASKYGYHVFAFWSSTCIWLSDHDADDGAGDRRSKYKATAAAPTATAATSTLNNNKLGSRTLSKRLNPHETEIFHIKPVSSELPQYIGSDIHFSCGYEVKSFLATTSEVVVCLKNSWERDGSIFVYIPRSNVDNIIVEVSGKKVKRKVGGWDIVCSVPHENALGRASCIGRVIRVWVVVHGDKSNNDGEVSVKF